MAMRGINKVILIGNLGQEPEIRYMPNGGPVVNLTIATSENWRDKQTGEIREKTEWHRVILFGKLAEISNEYLHKGSQVYIEGSLQTRKWQDQNNQERYITEIIVNINGTMQMLGNRSNNSSTSIHRTDTESSIKNKLTSSSSNIEVANKETEYNDQTIKNKRKVIENEDIINFDDDIPF